MVFFFGGDDGQVNWPRLVVMMLLIVIPVAILTSGLPQLYLISQFCAIVGGLSFGLKIEPKRSLTIAGIFMAYLLDFSLATKAG